MFVHNIDPVLFELGPLEVRYYGLAYVIGFLLAYWFLYRAVDSGSIKGWTRKRADDFIFYSMIGVVVGARLGYFLFYNPWYFWQDPLEILMVWRGGMSFHGGLLGFLATAYIYLKRKDLSFYQVADVLALPAAIGLGLGRVANFINGELVGKVTDLSWCVEFPGFDGCRHPAQLYLSLKNFAVAGILWFLEGRGSDGFLFWNFIFWYGAGRFFIDFLRVDPTFLGISMGQYLSLAMAIVGGFMIYRTRGVEG